MIPSAQQRILQQTGYPARRALAVMVALSAVHYLIWRVQVIHWHAWWIAVPLLLAEGLGIAHVLGFQYILWPRPSAPILPTQDCTSQPLYILIPTVDEGIEILQPTVLGAIAARRRYVEAYPNSRVTICICNDGKAAGVLHWEEVEVLAEQLGVECITRPVGGGAKAGNIEVARQRLGAVGDALLVIFDADQVAEPDFLLKTVPLLEDPGVGWVQTPQSYRNLENPVTRWAQEQQSLFYEVICPAKSAQNAAFICGTNVLLRASALDEIGGFPQDSITEDFAASILLHSRWRGIFLAEVLAQGLGPMDLKSYFAQQRRWAVGTMGVMRSHWRHLLLPGTKGLSLAQRIQYALAGTHYLAGLRDLIYLLSPLVFAFTGVSAIRGVGVTSFLEHFLPYWCLSQLAFWHSARGKSGLGGLLLGFGSFPVLTLALVNVLVGRNIGFTVTSKRRSGAQSWSQIIPHALAAIGCVAGILLCLSGIPGFERNCMPGPISWIVEAWMLQLLIGLLGTLWLSLRTAGVTAGAEGRACRRSPLASAAGAAALVG